MKVGGKECKITYFFMILISFYLMADDFLLMQVMFFPLVIHGSVSCPNQADV